MEPRQWPPERLRLELETLNRRWMSASANPLLAGRDSWPNQLPEMYGEELADAIRLGVRAFYFGSFEFFELIQGGQRFNWAISLEGGIRISPSIVSQNHSIRRISRAGHYKNEEFVVEPVKEAFAEAGVSFQ